MTRLDPSTTARAYCARAQIALRLRPALPAAGGARACAPGPGARGLAGGSARWQRARRRAPRASRRPRRARPRCSTRPPGSPARRCSSRPAPGARDAMPADADQLPRRPAATAVGDSSCAAASAACTRAPRGLLAGRRGELPAERRRSRRRDRHRQRPWSAGRRARLRLQLHRRRSRSDRAPARAAPARRAARARCCTSSRRPGSTPAVAHRDRRLGGRAARRRHLPRRLSGARATPARRSSTRAAGSSGSSRCRRGTFATNVRVQRYRGQPVLTWWQGTISRARLRPRRGRDLLELLPADRDRPRRRRPRRGPPRARSSTPGGIGADHRLEAALLRPRGRRRAGRRGGLRRRLPGDRRRHRARPLRVGLARPRAADRLLHAGRRRQRRLALRLVPPQLDRAATPTAAS